MHRPKNKKTDEAKISPEFIALKAKIRNFEAYSSADDLASDIDTFNAYCESIGVSGTCGLHKDTFLRWHSEIGKPVTLRRGE